MSAMWIPRETLYEIDKIIRKKLKEEKNWLLETPENTEEIKETERESDGSVISNYVAKIVDF